MPRNGCSTALDPGPGDVYTLTDGSQWQVLERDGDQLQMEALKTSVVRVWKVAVPRLLRSVAGWRGAGR